MKTKRNTLRILLGLIITAVISSCAEDVVSINLNSAHPHIVIEGKITNGNGPQTVRITKTADFFKPSDYPPVSGAVVKIADDKGSTETLAEKEPGLYTASNLTGIPGRTYTLTVVDNNKNYSSTSTMPKPSHIDSLSFEVQKRFQEENILHCYFTDTKDLKEYLRLKIFINGEQYRDYYMYQDRLSDGKNIDFEFNLDKKIFNGDIIVVEMQSVDRPVYEYFNTLGNALISLSDESGGAFSGTPGNPTSNITNGALGYFSAFTIRADTIVVRK